MLPPGDVDVNILLAAAGIIILAAFADLLDGAIARAMKAESQFGGLFDSMADAISFGVAPSVIVLKSLSISPGTEASFLMMMAAMIYSVCGVLRLIRFTVKNQESKTAEDLLAPVKTNFTGLPSPAAAGAVVSMTLFLFSSELHSIFVVTETQRMWTMFFTLLLIGYFMISQWRFPSLKALRIRVASFKVVFLTVLAAVVIFFGILHHFPVVFFVISWSYLVVSFVLSLIRITTGKKSKTLEDFEPTPEEEEE